MRKDYKSSNMRRQQKDPSLHRQPGRGRLQRTQLAYPNFSQASPGSLNLRVFFFLKTMRETERQLIPEVKGGKWRSVGGTRVSEKWQRNRARMLLDIRELVGDCIAAE